MNHHSFASSLARFKYVVQYCLSSFTIVSSENLKGNPLSATIIESVYSPLHTAAELNNVQVRTIKSVWLY